VLRRLLEESANLEIQAASPESYSEVIRKLIAAQQQPDKAYLARVPPYVFVAAEMQGADIEALATYQSNATNERTYHSWFVIKRSNLQTESPTPVPSPTTKFSLEDVVRFIKSRGNDPVRFVYHDKFSTSSYFLPSLFFREHNILSIANGGDGGDFAPIHSTKVDVKSSSGLIPMVASGSADIAAIWDGTMKNYVAKPGDDIVFIPLPYTVPNDLLVCSKRLNAEIKKSIRQAIVQPADFVKMAHDMNKTDLGDVSWWVPMGRATDAEESLANLRHLAQVHTYEVTVKVAAGAGVSVDNLDAVNRGIRLSQTEFVPFDPSYHKHADYNWTLQSTHDGAISLTSEIDGFEVEPQILPISFTDAEDLSKRISQLIHSRLHRIRYVWPYEDDTATIIRDVDFPLIAGSTIKARKVVWQDPFKDKATRELAFDVNVAKSDSNTFRLSGFTLQQDRSLGFDPMSNVSYQVLLMRPSEERPLFKAMTYGFVIALVMAAVAAIIDFRRRAKLVAAAQTSSGDLRQNYRDTLKNYFKSWRPKGADGKREIPDANVIWCNRIFLERFIAGLKSNANPKFDRVRKEKTGWSFFAKIPLLKDFFGLGANRSIDFETIYDPTEVDDPQRLSGVVPFLVESDLLAPFVGTQMEWDVLNTMALQRFEPMRPPPTNGNGKLVSRDNPILQSLVSEHFNQVLDDSMSKASFFNQTWELIGEQDGERTFVHKESITFLNGSQADAASEMILSFTLPKDAYLNGAVRDGKLNAWLLGRIHNRNCESENGLRSLRIDFKPVALLKE
jgi:ABC-type phosphate/phosphonate transport system substrate-binding protein